METVKEINFDQLEEQYGSELRKSIERDIDHADSRNAEWKFEVVDELKNSITFAFATRAYAQVYEVSKTRKIVVEKYLIGSVDGRKIIALMDSFKA